MPPLSILVLENDSSFASSLKINLKKWGLLDIFILKNANEALIYVQNNNIDLIITKPTLLEKGDGIEFGKKVSNISNPIIYIAEGSGNKFYEEAKKLNLLSFITKPFDYKTLYAALNFYFDNKENFLIIKKGKIKIRVRYDYIHWIKSSGNYCIIRAGESEYSMKISLSKLNATFLDNAFIQIHRAFIIRIDKIDDINVKMNLVNIKESKLPIGRKYRKAFFDKLDII